MRFLCLLLLILLSTTKLYSQFADSTIVKSKISYSPQFEAVSSMLEGSDSVVAQVERILFTRDTSLIYCKEGQYLKEFMFEELFPIIYPNDQIEYHFLNISKINDTFYKIRFMNKIDFTNWGNEYNNYFYANYIYDGCIRNIDGMWKLDVSLQMDSYEKVNSPFGRYIYDKSIYCKKDIKRRNYEIFSKSLSEKYKIQLPEKKLNYFISDRNDAYKIFGFTYSISTTGMFINEIGVLVSTELDYLDKHELTHFILSKYDTGKFISEGIAVYEGGSNGIECNEFILKTLKSGYYNLPEEQKTVWLSNFKNNKLEGGPYMTYYYACSALLIQEYLKIYDSESLGILIKKSGEISPQEFISEYLANTMTDPITFLQSLIEKTLHEK